MKRSVIIDIKPEYDSYIRGVWQNLSGKTSDVVVLKRELEEVYNTVSLSSIRFLRAKLESLEKQSC